MERKVTTIVAADVAGFSRLVARAEEEVFTRLRELRLDIIDPAVVAGGGRIIKTMGDGLLVEFPHPMAAVRAGQVVQRAVHRHEAGRCDDNRIRFRIGVNHGSVLIDGDDVLGDVVNIAARLETLCPPNGICISRSVRDMLFADTELSVCPRGKQFVRNIPFPVEVWQVETGVEDAGAAVQPGSADRPSVIVLPFDDASASGENSFLAEGIADEIINELSRFRSLFVIARGSSFSYRGGEKDIRQIAQDMRVRYVVQGAVRGAGDRLRVSVQLIEADTVEQIWSDRYDGNRASLFDFQDDITRRVVTRLAPEIGAHERQVSRRKPPENLSAWEMCQRGLSEMEARTIEGIHTAFDLFHSATKADSAYALPHALLGQWHSMRIYSGRSSDPGAEMLTGIYHARMAIRLDDRLETGYVALARLLTIRGAEADARDALARAVALNDNDAAVYSAQTFVNLFQAEPDTDEMLRAGLEAIRLSPRDPVAWSFHWMVVMALWMRDMELGENVREHLDAASRLPGAEAFVHIAVAVVALKRDDQPVADRAWKSVV